MPQNKIKKAQLQNQIKMNPEFYFTLSAINKEDEQLAEVAIMHMPSIVAELPINLKSNKKFFEKILTKMPVVFKYMIDELKEDKELINIFLKHQKKTDYRYLNIKHKLKEEAKEEDFKLSDIFTNKTKKNENILLFICNKLEKEIFELKEFFIQIDEKLKNNKVFILKLITYNPEFYQFIKPSFQEDIDIMKSVMSKKKSNFYLFDEELKNDEFFVLSMSEYGMIDKYDIGENLRIEAGNNEIIHYLKTKLLNQKLHNDLQKENKPIKKLKV